jgi:hypothetical protein
MTPTCVGSSKLARPIELEAFMHERKKFL